MDWVRVAWAADDGSDRDAADRLLAQQAAAGVRVGVADVTVSRLCPSCASTEHGRPVVLVHREPVGLGASIARTHGLVLVAVGSAPLGVDVEQVSLRLDDVRPVALHPDESAFSARDMAVVWTRKESLVKATGDGVRLPFNGIRVSDSGGDPVLVAWPRDPAPEVWMRHLDIGPSYAACLVVLGVQSLRLTVTAGGGPPTATA